MSYILVTPILNEAESLHQLKETVFGQTVRPVFWVIGDGGSTDRSYEIATEIFKEYGWVRVIKQKNYSDTGYSHKNFANNINDCMDFAKKMCAEGNIKYSFVGKTDATPILAGDYFEKLLAEMENNPKLAFTCGSQYLLHDQKGDIAGKKSSYQVIKGYNDIRLYRREFIEMGGYPVFFAPDSVLMIKALNKGWDIKKVEKTYFVKSRVNGSKIGYWNGYKLKGKGMYTLGYNPILLFLIAVYFTRSYPFSVG